MQRLENALAAALLAIGVWGLARYLLHHLCSVEAEENQDDGRAVQGKSEIH
jgi:hypothetical protein